MMNIILSKTFNYLRFPLIVGVVLIHAYSSEVHFDDSSSSGIALENIFLDKFRYLITSIFAGMSVPIFFLISGYLFFNNIEKFDLKTYKTKVKSRVATLLIPYLIWNCLVLLLFIVGQHLPVTAHLFSETSQIQVNCTNLIEVLFYRNGYYPIAFQFWFIRDLFIICLFTPIIYFAINKFKYWIVIILMILWFIGISAIHPLIITSIMFFSIGAMFNILKVDMLTTFSKMYKLVLLSYPILVSCLLLTPQLAVNEYVPKIVMLLGIILVFNITSRSIEKNTIKVNAFLSGASFFVFAVHEPMLKFIKKLIVKIFSPISDLSYTLICLSCSVLVILIGLSLYLLIYKRALIRKILVGR